MMDLKKLLALGAFCTVGVMACDQESSDLGSGETCTVEGSDATFEQVCVTDDAGVENCGCPTGAGGAGGEPTGGTPAGGAGGGEPPPPADPTVTLSWDGDNIVFKILTSAENGPYLFGAAETGNGENGWYGEDCIEGVKNGKDVCHSVPENGELTLTHVASVDEVDDGKTLFKAGLANGTTYVLIRDTEENQGCWTWGHNTSYYKDPPLGCNEIEPTME